MLLAKILADKPDRLISVNDDSHVSFIYEVMKSNHVHHVAVMQADRYVGIVDQEALLDAIMISPQNFNSLEAADIMRKNLPHISPNDKVEDLLEQMRDRDVQALPYFEDGRCRTLITRTDLLRLINQQLFEDEGLVDQAVAKGEVAMANPVVRRLLGTLSDLGI